MAGPSCAPPQDGAILSECAGPDLPTVSPHASLCLAVRRALRGSPRAGMLMGQVAVAAPIVISLEKLGRSIGVSIAHFGEEWFEVHASTASLVLGVGSWLDRVQRGGELVEIRSGPRLVGVAAQRHLLLAIVARAVLLLG